MVNPIVKLKRGPGLHAPARLLCAALAALSSPAIAQVPAAPQAAPASSVPIPDSLELAKLIWSTMAAVDHANQAGNYSVLRDLAAPGFQIANDAARLTQIFASLRASGIDLSTTLLLAPTYTGTPRFVQPGILEVKGLFGLRPTAIAFDLYYQWIGGKWRLFGVSIAPVQLAGQLAGPQPAPPQPGRRN